MERATIAEQGLEAAKARQAETEAALWKSLADTEAALQRSLESERNALESQRKARSEADQEVLALRGRVMGTEEANAWLRKQVTRQVEGLSILETTCLGKYFFCSRCVGFFL